MEQFIVPIILFAAAAAGIVFLVVRARARKADAAALARPKGKPTAGRTGAPKGSASFPAASNPSNPRRSTLGS